MISIIICGRNDNYGGNFNERLFSTVSYNLAEFRRRQIACELIFVEWNPVEGTPLLSEQIAERYPEARCFVMGELIHRYVSENRHISVFEFHAKNAGARRARGDWLLFTNPDNYFGEEVFDFLQKGALDPLAFYRAARVQIDSFEDIGQLDLVDPSPEAKPPFGGAAGDFILCPKQVFDRLGGYREDLAFSNTHMDSILNIQMFEELQRSYKIGLIYHLRHERDQHSIRRIDFDFGKVTATPQPNYGLAGADEKQLRSPQIIELLLPEHLAAEAMAKAPVDPVIPEYLRRQPEPGPVKRLFSRLFNTA